MRHRKGVATGGRSRSRVRTQNLFCHSQEKRELIGLPAMAPRTLTPSLLTVPLFKQTKQTHNLGGSKLGKIPFSSTQQAPGTNGDWCEAPFSLPLFHCPRQWFQCHGNPLITYFYSPGTQVAEVVGLS